MKEKYCITRYLYPLVNEVANIDAWNVKDSNKKIKAMKVVRKFT